jgi:hypothetical protein
MKVKMLASMRAHTLRGLKKLEQQTKAAGREAGKAFLPSSQAVEQLGRVAIAIDALPVGDAQSEVWDVQQDIVLTYRDALFMAAIEVNKTLQREKEFQNDDAAQATRAQLNEIQEVMRALGDQRDLFASFEDEEEEDPEEEDEDTSHRQMELVDA